MARSDIRTDETIENDRAGVRRQIKKIQDLETSRLYQRGLFDTIRGRRAGGRPGGGHGRRLPSPGGGLRSGDGGGLPSGDGGPGPYEVDKIDIGEDFVVGVTGEVLVLAQHASRALQTLEPAGFKGDPIPELNDKVFRFTNPGASLGTAHALAQALQARNITASLNYVEPLGYVAKGEGGFEPTTVKETYLGPGEGKGTGVRVAVIDTGIAKEEKPREDGWLTNVPRVDGSIDVLYQAEPDLLHLAAGHGTFAAGVVQRVDPTADIVAYQAVAPDGIGSDVEVAITVLKAARDGAKLINLSLGTEVDEDLRTRVRPVAMLVALEILAQEHPDVLLVAAAGNSGSRRPNWPAAFPEVVAVASLTDDFQPSEWSNRGPWVDCSAVGEGVVAPYVVGTESDLVDKDGGDTFTAPSWAIGTGTSFAAPQVAGAIAKLMSTHGWSAHKARDELLSSRSGYFVDRRPGFGWCLDIIEGTPQ